MWEYLSCVTTSYSISVSRLWRLWIRQNFVIGNFDLNICQGSARWWLYGWISIACCHIICKHNCFNLTSKIMVWKAIFTYFTYQTFTRNFLGKKCTHYVSICGIFLLCTMLLFFNILHTLLKLNSQWIKKQ
jgi:hypothetical protein